MFNSVPPVLRDYPHVSAAIRGIYDACVALEMPQTYFESAMCFDFERKLDQSAQNYAELLAFGKGMAAAYLDVIQRVHCEYLYITETSTLNSATVFITEAEGVYSLWHGSVLRQMKQMPEAERATAKGGYAWKTRSVASTFLPFGVFLTDQQRIDSALNSVDRRSTGRDEPNSLGSAS